MNAVLASRRKVLEGLGGLALMAAAPPLGSRSLAAVAVSESPGKLTVTGAKYALGDDGYELQRGGAVWQAMKPRRYPDLVVQAETSADVVETLRFARDQHLPVAVRCGGHSYVASFLRDGGILLDVSRLRGVQVDRDSRTVLAQPGIRSAELSILLAEHDLAFPVAHVATVSLGGYLLGGGMGWNGDWWGRIACANVRAVELVTAAGESLTANPSSHPDLFAAARGAGPTFCGVVTRFHLRAFPQPRTILRSTYTFPLEAAPIVARWLQQAAEQRHPNLELTLALESEPAAESEGGAGHVQYCFASATCFAGDEKQARAMLTALARTAPAVEAVQREESRPVTMQDLFGASHSGAPRRMAADNIWTHRPVEALDALVPRYAKTPSPHSVVITNFRSHSRVAEDGVYSVMAPVYLMWIASWDAPDGDAANLRWVDEAARLLQPFSDGSYINETDFFSRPERARQCFSTTAWERLKAVRARHDPMRLFPSPFPI